MEQRIFMAIALLLANFGIFAITAALLPRRGSFGSSGPWSHFVNSRAHWDVAWAVLVGTLAISAGAFLACEAFGWWRKTSPSA